ncbi:unnamed protein product, partial [Chrysoparadoxa australica]
YPVACVDDLDPNIPTRVQLLGEQLCVWKDGEDKWQVFSDRCPHRWAPLSEGRIDLETKELQCSYHGWSFDSNGSCTSIPQVRTLTLNCYRACATVFPAQVKQTLLWVWADVSPEGLAACSESSGPTVMPELEHTAKGDKFEGCWYTRDMPYGFDTLIENLGDPSHLPHAHHGVVGKRSGARPLQITLDQSKGYTTNLFSMSAPFDDAPNAELSFKPPCLLYYKSDYTEGMSKLRDIIVPPLLRPLISLCLRLEKPEAMTSLTKPPEPNFTNIFAGYAVPTSPYHCRLILCNARNFFKWSVHMVWQKLTFANRVKKHLSQHRVLDGDNILLHREELEMARGIPEGKGSLDRAFYMPTAADVPARAFRSWLQDAGLPRWRGGVDTEVPQPLFDRVKLLDRSLR